MGLRLNELSPLVPESVNIIFKKKYKGSTIDRPPELNGLDEINIYQPSDDDPDLSRSNSLMENVVLQMQPDLIV